MTRTGFLAMSLVAISVHAAPPEPEDFARGIPLETTKNADTYELRVPEAVYEIATRPNLGDLRVFDAAGKIVQHALCEVIEHDEPVISRHALTAYGLPPGRDPARQLGTQLAIDIPGGARIRLEEEGRETATRTGGAFEYVLDTRESEDPLTGLELDWQWTSPEGRAELPLKIKASDDLDQWRTVVTRTTLLRIAGGEGPQRITVELPERRYRFLRLVPLDERARDWLETPWALSEHKQNIQTTSIRVAGEALPVDPDNSHIRYFRRDRPAPARELQFDLPDPRLILDVRVSSRNDEDADWRVRTRGRITGRGNDDSSESLEISAIDDDLWRVEVLAGAEALSNQPPHLH